MKIESQVCSLELAKRLKELGVKQESLFYTHPDAGTIIYSPNSPLFHTESNTIWISAFTASELGEMLPRCIKLNECEFYYTQIPSQHLDKWVIFYRTVLNSWTGQDQEDENEVNARAKNAYLSFRKQINGISQ